MFHQTNLTQQSDDSISVFVCYFVLLLSECFPPGFFREMQLFNEQCVRECVYISVCDLKILLIPPFRKRFAVILERRTLLRKGSEFGEE